MRLTLQPESLLGAPFGKIVDSLVNDIGMPLITTFWGQNRLYQTFYVLSTLLENLPRTFDALKKAGIPIFAYSNFITISINFILLVFVIFQMVKIINKIRNEEQKPTSPTPENIMLIREIRDSLKK